jgi:hypothetical protein
MIITKRIFLKIRGYTVYKYWGVNYLMKRGKQVPLWPQNNL